MLKLSIKQLIFVSIIQFRFIYVLGVNTESLSHQTMKKVTIISNTVIVQASASTSNIDARTPNQFNPSNGDNAETLSIVKEIIDAILTDAERSLSLLHNITKDGKTRKRRKYLQSLEDRRLNKKMKKRQLHSINASCREDGCIKKCYVKVSDKQRLLINEDFWKMCNKDQRQFILNNVCRTLTKRHTNAPAASRRSSTMSYSFKNVEGYRTEVCKKFFLTTLGFKKTNDKLIRSVFNEIEKNAITPKTDGRGKPNNKKFDRELIVKHIESFNPNIAHYRREHAPLRKYLPSDLTIKLMFEDFKEKHPDIRFSYYLYREVVSSLNISFSKLGHEECFVCEVFLKHSKESGHQKGSLNLECEECRAWSIHHERYVSARAQYQKDCSEFDAVITADLQKVIKVFKMF